MIWTNNDHTHIQIHQLLFVWTIRVVFLKNMEPLKPTHLHKESNMKAKFCGACAIYTRMAKHTACDFDASFGVQHVSANSPRLKVGGCCKTPPICQLTYSTRFMCMADQFPSTRRLHLPSIWPSVQRTNHRTLGSDERATLGLDLNSSDVQAISSFQHKVECR